MATGTWVPCVLLSMCSWGFGAVVYTPVIDPIDGGQVVGIGGSGPLEIDFDGGGEIDVTFRRNSSSHYRVISPGQTRILGEDVSATASNFHALNLQAGDELGPSFIGGEGGWYAGAPNIVTGIGELLMNLCDSAGVETRCWGNFFQRDPFEYLGVEFEIDGATHYGWVEIESWELAPRVEIHGFAYESVAGRSIIAGQIPEPSVAALLIGGAGAFLLRRRRM